MIHLYVLDLDGCISIPFKQPDWESIEKIRSWNAASKNDSHIPPISLLTGRPQPYAECVAQWLGVELPFIFESGGGLYQLGSNRLEFNPILTHTDIDKVQELRCIIQTHIIPKYPEAYPEFTKYSDCGLVHPDTLAIRAIMPKIKEWMEALRMHDFEMHHTEISINVIHKQSNKASGLKWLMQELSIPSMNNIAYIGDSSGDIPALQIAGMPLAPANATAEVRNLPNIEISKFTATQAVAAFYEKIMTFNKNLI